MLFIGIYIWILDITVTRSVSTVLFYIFTLLIISILISTAPWMMIAKWLIVHTVGQATPAIFEWTGETVFQWQMCVLAHCIAIWPPLDLNDLKLKNCGPTGPIIVSTTNKKKESNARPAVRKFDKSGTNGTSIGVRRKKLCRIKVKRRVETIFWRVLAVEQIPHIAILCSNSSDHSGQIMGTYLASMPGTKYCRTCWTLALFSPPLVAFEGAGTVVVFAQRKVFQPRRFHPVSSWETQWNVITIVANPCSICLGMCWGYLDHGHGSSKLSYVFLVLFLFMTSSHPLGKAW